MAIRNQRQIQDFPEEGTPTQKGALTQFLAKFHRKLDSGWGGGGVGKGVRPKFYSVNAPLVTSLKVIKVNRADAMYVVYLPWFTRVCLHHADLISEQFIAIPQFFELRPPPTPPKKTTTFMSDVEHEHLPG